MNPVQVQETDTLSIFDVALVWTALTHIQVSPGNGNGIAVSKTSRGTHSTHGY